MLINLGANNWSISLTVFSSVSVLLVNNLLGYLLRWLAALSAPHHIDAHHEALPTHITCMVP